MQFNAIRRLFVCMGVPCVSVLKFGIITPYLALLNIRSCYTEEVVLQLLRSSLNVFQFCYMALRLVHWGKLIEMCSTSWLIGSS